MDSGQIVWAGVIASLCASLGTAAGSLGVLLVKQLSRRLEDGLLSLAAGIMLAACFFSLLLPGLNYSQQLYVSELTAGLVVAGGVMAGALLLFFIHQTVPHEHFISGRDGASQTKLARIWLFVFAITLHNFPEGLAVGVGFAGGEMANGVSLALGIGLQNIPEGLAVSVALLSIGFSRWRAALIGIASGLVEPLGGLVGAMAVSGAEAFMPWALAFAAGAMLFIISDEIIPETHQNGHQNVATFSLLIGFVTMMLLDVLLG
ncbi:ZIP family metal transporter [Alteromonas lipolytica]|uniref:Protein gufA n=1 Tax=Alteromonas lipolytica TaxID=1856405 RepID=A0A1E8F940_9ALTE|nr:ZIP family metal transporter [Alteromonas lipolytica]OFI32441.1 protein gufA [Alteromonas lipolytica]GGF79625.1 ZIP family metal transporter [Alteromonas lipolytica]